MGLNLNFILNLTKKLLIIGNIIAFSFMVSILINSYIALKNFYIPEKIKIVPSRISQKTQYLPFIESIFIKIPVSSNTSSSTYQKEKTIHTLNNISLVGTMLFDKKRIALIKHNGKLLLAKKGQVINGYKVVKIDKSAVYVEKNGKIYKITTKLSRTESKTLANTRSGSKIYNYTASQQVIKLSRGLVEKETADIGNLLKDVRLIPIVKNGETIGFKFTYINPRSLLYKYGLRSGDLIRSVNGMPVRTAEEAFKIYNMLRNESRIRLEIDRNGQRKVIIYEIQ